MTRTTRRETNRLHAEITEGLAEYLEERGRAAKIDRCGTIAEDVPDRWLRLMVQTASPGAIYLPEFHFVLDGAQGPQSLVLH